MTNHEFTETSGSEKPDFPTSRRPLGFWLKLVDRRISDEMGALFADEGITRRDWRTLNLLAGDADDERLAHKLRHRPDLLGRLADLGWVDVPADPHDGPSLTDAGRTARDRLLERVTGLRARVAGAVSPEDFATTLATLEAIARELGWDESQPMPRGRRGGRGFGRRFAHGFGHGRRGFPGFAPGAGPEHDGYGHERGGHERDFGRGPRAGFGPHPHPAPHQDVHVHVHVHEHHGRKHRRGEAPGRS
ncbi:MarR family winged helix-turn-helix transcriptional regulator [Agromyces larvae]|uniref:MarR family winged helix-turn-helix transcriptional regulator n=1 Tax=Agromyces larvae TaxID=2929802 RepID=A0ABY4C016_9MICO|nr:MarR family winged helix-turn-helix transcriptional regulator [Agromyces larvae]UOE43286.1 MarR family winged helix-turn-helix transcriptional regulator [Agromyces larvae]